MKNLTVEILIGLPGSGKSTYAKNKVANSNNWIRVNRDDFRAMLKNQGMCENKIEGMITELVNHTILKALSMKQNVIIDNTNLKTKYIDGFCELVKHHADVTFTLFDVPPKTCIERDSKRPNPVGEEVINRMNKDFVITKDSLDWSNRPKVKKEYVTPVFNVYVPNAYIVDIDGTIAHMNNRSPYDWDKVDDDTPDALVTELLGYIASTKECQIILVSGRDSVCRNKTIEWLDFYKIPYDYLYMREQGDMRKDTIVKKQIYDAHIKYKFNILGVFDDRLSVCQQWYDMGLKVFRVGNPSEEF